MKKLICLLPMAAAFVFAMLAFAGTAHAQAIRTWVSGVGDDANPCSRTAPCKTFAGAISKTAIHGEINCIDPGGFGAVTITKSITIDCHEVFASIANTGTNGIIINFTAFPVTDARKQVRLRNLNLQGADTGLIGVRIIGAATGDTEVFIEDMLIDGNVGGSARGISDERTGGGELTILNTTVRNMGGNGIHLVGGSVLQAVLSNVRVMNCASAIVAGSGIRMMLDGAVISGNANGVFLSAGAEVNVDNSVISGNGTGVNNSGTVRLANTDIAFNFTAITGASLSFRNNRIQGNSNAGNAPTPIGGADTNPRGQE